jgi:hypothetical protein
VANTRIVAKAPVVAEHATPVVQRDTGTQGPRVDSGASTQPPDPIRPRHSSYPDRYRPQGQTGSADGTGDSIRGDRSGAWSDRAGSRWPVDSGDQAPAYSAERVPGDLSPTPADQTSAPAAQTAP